MQRLLGLRFDKHAFRLLNIAQFFAVLNDNLFKFLTIYLLIDLLGKEASSDILFWVGVCFVLPFLLFSTSGGILADRFSKQKIIVWLKGLEILVIAMGFVAYYYKSVYGCYSTLFMLCFQSALLSPSKFSIVPEIVRKELIPKANGMITASSYMAMIVGTFLASFLTRVTDRNFLLCLCVCMIAAVIGFIASLYIPYTPPFKSKEKLSFNFVAQTVQTLKYCKKTPRLFLAVVGSAFFLFIGAFVQLNAIPFAMDFLNLSEVGGGDLFLGTAVGIAVGSALASKFCKKEIDLGLSCFSLFILSIALFALPIVKFSLAGSVIVLFALGLFGGLYVVPLEAYIQSHSPSELRGRVFAAENFLSFLGVLLAPLCLFLFGKVMKVSSAAGFVVMSFIIFISFLVMFRHLAVHLLNFLAKRFHNVIYDLHFKGYPFGPNYTEEKIAILVRGSSIRNIAILLGESSKLHLIFIKEKKAFYDSLFRFFNNIEVMSLEDNLEEKFSRLPQSARPALFFLDTSNYRSFEQKGLFRFMKGELGFDLRRFHVKHISRFNPDWYQLLKRTKIQVQFEVLKLEVNHGNYQEADLELSELHKVALQ
jgi:acyl-[acyl-carrier-protein]-phospholipid O-acyltransferase/long-chain-fatty-acid--[acyl-carrier-protein] ligase